MARPGSIQKELGNGLTVVSEYLESAYVLTFDGTIPYLRKSENPEIEEDGNYVSFVLTVKKENLLNYPDVKITYGDLEIPKSWIKRNKLRLRMKVNTPGQSQKLTVTWSPTQEEQFTIQVTPESKLESVPYLSGH